MALKIVTQPASEPIEVSDVEAQIRYELVMDSAYASGLIAAVRQRTEGLLRRALVTQTWDLVLDNFPRPHYQYPLVSLHGKSKTQSVEIPLPPLQSVVSVAYMDVSGALVTLAPSAYAVDTDSTPGRVMPAYNTTWPATLDYPGAVRVRFTAGYGLPADVPQCIKNWMLINIANLWENRESETVASGKLTAVDLSTMADGLLDPVRWEQRT